MILVCFSLALYEFMNGGCLNAFHLAVLDDSWGANEIELLNSLARPVCICRRRYTAEHTAGEADELMPTWPPSGSIPQGMGGNAGLLDPPPFSKAH